MKARYLMRDMEWYRMMMIIIMLQFLETEM